VKTQAISLYRKLGVSSRSDAIDRATRLGLVERATVCPRATLWAPDDARLRTPVMVLIIAIILALLLPSPANIVVLILGVIGEVGGGRHLGSQAREAMAAEDRSRGDDRTAGGGRGGLSADGSGPRHGELWEARCAAGADVGDRHDPRARRAHARRRAECGIRRARGTSTAG
jgi:hypothetical protein